MNKRFQPLPVTLWNEASYKKRLLESKKMKELTIQYTS